jgi:hypothetical protein
VVIKTSMVNTSFGFRSTLKVARVFAIACALLSQAGAVFAQGSPRGIEPFSGRRLALVIGNRDYTWKPLVNPTNDARAVAAALSDVGFSNANIKLVLDAPRESLRRSVREFVEAVRAGDLVLVYYSGHGVEIKGTNYLLPTDLPLHATEGYVEDEAVSAQRVLDNLHDQGARVRILILDACRDNPLPATKSEAGGLAPMEGKGSLIVFATEARHTASDSPTSPNSVFTQYLLQGLKMPGISIDDAMKQVSRTVARVTREQQVPAIYGLLLDDVILKPGAPIPSPVEDPRIIRLRRSLQNGVGTFTFGMSPGQVNSHFPTPFGDTSWEKLPVAGEYSSTQVRYFWIPLAQFAPDVFAFKPLLTWSSCWQSGQSYVTFLFNSTGLMRVSFRLYPDCGQRLALLRSLADNIGVTNFNGSGPIAFQMPVGDTTVAGTLAPTAWLPSKSLLPVRPSLRSNGFEELLNSSNRSSFARPFFTYSASGKAVTGATPTDNLTYL